jgi:protein-L-isoaspartate(D-aspartate) O-methyltransferase
MEGAQVQNAGGNNIDVYALGAQSTAMIRFVKLLGVLVIATASSIGLQASHRTDDPRVAERTAMIRIVARKLRAENVPRDHFFAATIGAMRRTPRHLFMPDAVRAQAYENRPLSIGYDQTISAPSIVAQMTALLHPKKSDVILEIGTGSGYQAAILAQLVRQVYTIEIIAPLATEAAARLASLGYANVTVRSGDGYAGWPENAPFDGIIVTAGATRIPPALLVQLKPGGRMVIPLGPNWAQQELVLVEKSKQGTVTQRSYGQVFFVDFTGQMPRRP